MTQKMAIEDITEQLEREKKKYREEREKCENLKSKRRGRIE